MKNLRRILMAAMLLVIPTTTTAAGVVTGNELHGWMQHVPKKGETAGAAAGLALGFVIGVIEGSGGACYGSITREQALDIVRLYLERHPELRHQYAAGLVRTAIEEKFPCPKK